MVHELKPGARLYSSVDPTEFIVVKAPGRPVGIELGGVPVELDPERRMSGEAVVADQPLQVLAGKRYVNSDGSLELLCTKAGSAVPAVDGELLALRDAKPLPASD